MLRILRQAREEAGLSQRALARRLGVHASWVAKTELGERRLDVVEFLQLASALGKDPAKLVATLVRAARR
jgi:transcriptional regulator with XRE-family HTH domain